MTKIVKFGFIVAIFPNLVANDYKSHVVVNGLVTFWLIFTSVCYSMWAHFLLTYYATIFFLSYGQVFRVAPLEIFLLFLFLFCSKSVTQVVH
jgi:hypothetical protein